MIRSSVLLGRLVHKTSKILKRSGSTWPGHIALKINPKLIRTIIANNPDLKIILVAGTNGKTTTTKAISHALATHDKVLTNSSGANLLNGLASTLVTNSDLSGKLNQRILIFETDENSLPTILKEIPTPTAIILLNLFRDQLDRYGEVNTTADKWLKAIKHLTDRTLIVANADDPLIAYIGSKAKKSIFFGVPAKYKNERALSHAVDSTTCPKCSSPLDYISISYSHLGNYICPNCSYTNPKSESLDIETSLLGTYNQYNLNAAGSILKHVFSYKDKEILAAFSELMPAFGRQEEIIISEKKVMYLLSKNPTGFNESLKVAIDNRSNTLLILLNDRIPDGRDISWIWDVDFEMLKKSKSKIFISGDRCYDMSNRLIFADVTHTVIEDIGNAVKSSLSSTSENERLTILPTYSAMLEVRKIISGRSIL